MVFYVNNKTITYFDSFGVEHIPKEIIKFIRSKELGYAVDNKNIIKIFIEYKHMIQ